MRITFLGTGAATSYPLAFCRCAYCMQARQGGLREMRKRAAVMINNDLLIDLGPDVPAACALYGLALTDVRCWLQTHAHSDHFGAGHLATRDPAYMGVDTPPLELYASRESLDVMSRMVAAEEAFRDLLDAGEQQRYNLRARAVRPGEAFSACGYNILPLAANHDNALMSLLYAVTQGGRSLLYALDTDALPEPTWEQLCAGGYKFNAVVLDHTYGPGADGGGHLNAERFLAQVDRLHAEELLAPGARILASHISHEGNPPQAAFAALAAEKGYEVAYDGLVVELG